MIKQQINLYQERFHEKKVWFSANQVALALLVVIVIGAAWSLLLHTQLGTAQEKNQLVKNERNRLAAELAVANAELSQLLEDTRLDQDIDNTARQISARKKVLAFVDANRFGSGQGFSDYLVALSNLHIDDVWLDHIRFAEDYVQIEGSSLNAEVVPIYFDRFSQETVFQGNRFDLFQVSRQADTDWKVDFAIATSGAASE